MKQPSLKWRCPPLHWPSAPSSANVPPYDSTVLPSTGQGFTLVALWLNQVTLSSPPMVVCRLLEPVCLPLVALSSSPLAL